MTKGPTPRPAPDRFYEKVSPPDENGCRNWTASTHKGYGRFGAGRHGAGWLAAHRWVWEYEVGPIPDGLTVDHLCRNRACQNVGHMELVTRAENTRRAQAGRTQTHCRRGHMLVEGNLYSTPHGRQCMTCKKLTANRRYAATKAVAA